MTVSEALAISIREKKSVPCPFSRAQMHPSTCVCKGTRMVEACTACDGSGWNAKMQKVCGPCGSRGARPAINTKPAAGQKGEGS